jgi:hypothetical protein
LAENSVVVDAAALGPAANYAEQLWEVDLD